MLPQNVAGLRRRCGFRARSVVLAEELLLQHPLFEIVLGVEEHGERDVAVLADFDGRDVAHFGEVGGGADRALLGLEDIES